tara:strand:+ start:79780 stop:80526 length:747 start_codon:yes stop_codon:yes gene_type:complete
MNKVLKLLSNKDLSNDAKESKLRLLISSSRELKLASKDKEEIAEIIRVLTLSPLDLSLKNALVYRLFNSEPIVNQEHSERLTFSISFREILNIKEKLLKSIEVRRIVDLGSGEGFLLWIFSYLLNSKSLVGIELDTDKFNYSTSIKTYGESNLISFYNESFFEFTDLNSNDLVISYDPFNSYPKDQTIKLFNMLASLKVNNVILIEGYTNSFSQAVQNLNLCRVINKIENLKDSRPSRKRYIYHLSFS